jgi:hypothetical protein|tara:strand:- start:1261 stop:1644 length:384 start_codon:yes stop_codon:yes gene_type:complete
MAFDDVKPRYGKVYNLIEPRKGGGMFPGFRKFKGVYLGSNPVITHWCLRTESAEGHVFVTRSSEGNIEVYHQRNPTLKETWLSDGEDGPCWPEGIEVSEFNGDLKESEINYLEGILNRHMLRERKVA